MLFSINLGIFRQISYCYRMTADVQNEEGRFLLVYGTETGQAKAIAEIIRDKAVEKGLHPVTFCFSQSDKGVGTRYTHTTHMPTYAHTHAHSCSTPHTP